MVTNVAHIQQITIYNAPTQTNQDNQAVGIDMVLIYDDYNDWWVWVESHNHDIELSPCFDEEQDAKLWRIRIRNILKEDAKHERTLG